MGGGRDLEADARRQHLAVAITVGLAVGLALSLATDHWSEIVVGLVLGFMIGLAYHRVGSTGTHEQGQGHLS